MKGAPLPPISTSNCALIVHDMQNDFLKDSISQPNIHEIVQKVRSLIDLCHSSLVPVIYTRVETDPSISGPPERNPYLHKPGRVLSVKGTSGADIIDELRPQQMDYVITKFKSSAFANMNMERILRAKGAWILLAVGGSVHHGIEWLARDAYLRDLVTVVLQDITYSSLPESHASSLRDIDDFLGYVMNSEDVIKRLEAKR